jgi:hypothetical protein
MESERVHHDGAKMLLTFPSHSISCAIFLDELEVDMAHTLFRRAIVVLLALLFTSGCASWHDERRSDAGYLSDGGTGGGWNTIESITAPP